MNPVDPRPPQGGVQRAGGAQHEHRDPINPGIENAHGRVHQTDIAVHHSRHWPATGLGVAVSERDGDFLVVAEDEGRIFIAVVVDQAVVQPSEAGARVERRIFHPEPAQHVGDDVAAPFGCARPHRLNGELVRHGR